MGRLSSSSASSCGRAWPAQLVRPTHPCSSSSPCARPPQPAPAIGASGRELAVCRRSRPTRSSRLQVSAALFEPPPFQPQKLSVQFLAGGRHGPRAALPASRRYTLTHNDITGALTLSIGPDYNARQVQGFYTRILRDEITAEWLFASYASCGSSNANGSSSSRSSSSGGAAQAPAELHVYCHVSGEERWLAPPQLRNFIFRREMTLVLDTFAYADAGFLACFPELLDAKVFVHFQSDVQDLDLREYWGVLGDKSSWRRMPKGLLARLKLLLFGFPAVQHTQPRSSLTWQQQLRQQQQLEQQLLQQQQPAGAGPPSAAVPSVATAAAAAAAQWHPRAEAAVEASRPVALSLQQQRHARQPGAAAASEAARQRAPASGNAGGSRGGCAAAAVVAAAPAGGAGGPPNEQQQQQECVVVQSVAGRQERVGRSAAFGAGDPPASRRSSSSSSRVQAGAAAGSRQGVAEADVASSVSLDSAPAPACTDQQPQQPLQQQQPQASTAAAAAAAAEQELVEYCVWLRPGGQRLQHQAGMSCIASSRSGSSSGSVVPLVPVVVLNGSSAVQGTVQLQAASQQQPEQQQQQLQGVRWPVTAVAVARASAPRRGG